MQREADLHVHTCFSDGSFTPEEAMAYAENRGLGCIAIADHDSVDAIPAAVSLQKLYSIELIAAVEITAQENGKELHILGYFIDWQNEELKKRLKEICRGRRERMYKMADKLKEHGIDVNVEEVIKYAKTNSLSRLHLARYLVEKRYLPSLKTVFDKYIGDDKPCYISRFRFSSKEVINIIKNAGGIAIIAHPGLNNVSELLPALVENGIEGVEAYHSDYKKATSENLKKFAERHNLLITGGSDCHGDSKNKRLMGKTKLPYTYVQKMKEYAQQKRK